MASARRGDAFLAAHPRLGLANTITAQQSRCDALRLDPRNASHSIWIANIQALVCLFILLPMGIFHNTRDLYRPWAMPSRDHHLLHSLSVVVTGTLHRMQVLVTLNFYRRVQTQQTRMFGRKLLMSVVFVLCVRNPGGVGQDAGSSGKYN